MVVPPPPQSPPSATHTAGRVALLYALLGMAWIVGSDIVMGRGAPGAGDLVVVSILKGLGFILVTALGLFLLVRRDTVRERRAAAAMVSNEKRFRAQYHAIPLPTFTWRRVGETLVLLDCNVMAAALMGEREIGVDAREFFLGAPDTLGLLLACGPDTPPAHVAERFAVGDESMPRWRESRITYVAPDLVLHHMVDVEAQRSTEAERERVQAELQRTAAVLDVLFDKLPIGLAFLDTDLRYTRVNRRLCEMTGVPAEERIGRRPSDILPELSEEFTESLRRVLRTGQSISTELALRLPEFQPADRVFCVGCFPIRIGAEGTTLLGVLLQDITDERAAATALEDTVALLRGTLDSAAEGILVVDLEGRVVVSNRRFAAMFGLDPEEPLTGQPAQALDEAIRQLLAEPDRALRGTLAAHDDPKTEGFDIVALSNGTVLERRSIPHRVGGRIAGRLWSFRDVTEARRAEDALRESETRFRLMVEGSEQVFYYTHDREGIFRYVSPSVRAVLGYTPEELVGRPYWHTFPAGLPEEEVHERTARALAGETSGTPYSVINETPDGRLVTLEVTESPLIENGAVVGVQGFARDVTQRHRLEEELLQAQKMEAIGRLAGGVAHDFNNILTVINGSAHVALDIARGDPHMTRLLGEIQAAADRAASLTRQLLAFGRKQVLQPRALDLNAVLLGTERMLRRVIGEDVALTVIRDPRVRPTWADPGQVEQVLMNLVVNARDAMPSGGSLRIATSLVAVHDPPHPIRPGEFVLLEVADTGVGIAPDLVPRIFEPFFTTKPAGAGTGLGLATVYGIVRQAGGWVTVDTQAGAGATFRAFFPVYLGTPGEPPAPEEQVGAQRGSERILVVEDEPAVRRLVRVVLQRYGYEILDAADGKDGLRVIREQRKPLDLILSDVVMPGMSGPELLEQCRALCPEAKLVLMSGYTGDRLPSPDSAAGQIPVLEKPFEPAELARAIRSILDGNGAQRTARETPSDRKRPPA